MKNGRGVRRLGKRGCKIERIRLMKVMVLILKKLERILI